MLFLTSSPETFALRLMLASAEMLVLLIVLSKQKFQVEYDMILRHLNGSRGHSALDQAE